MELKEYMKLLVELESAKALIAVLEAENRSLKEANIKANPINHFDILRES